MTASPYFKLAEALDTNFQGIPKKDGEFSPSFLEYLELLFSPEEAEVAAYLGVAPLFMASKDIAQKMGKPIEQVQEPLDALADRKVVIGGGGAYTGDQGEPRRRPEQSAAAVIRRSARQISAPISIA